MVAGGFARRLFCVVLAMLLESSEGKVGGKGEAAKVELRADTQKEDRSEDKIRVFVIGLDENRKLIGYCLPRKFRYTLPARLSDTCTCVPLLTFTP